MYLDDLPVWGFIGKTEKYVKTRTFRHFLFTHFHYEVRSGCRYVPSGVGASRMYRECCADDLGEG